nr:DNA repair protein RecN [Anaerolineae bacterium]
MLSEITIQDFAIIDEITLQFAEGFNVLTGETGAGKSIILDAMALLMGGRADSSEIRTGAEKALVEAVFVLKKKTAESAAIQPILQREELQSDDPGTLLLSREVRRGGRNICRVNGRPVTLAVLQEISEVLVDIHGQSDHLSLQKPSEHIGLLDRYASLSGQREAFSGLVQQVMKVRDDLHALEQSEAQRQQQAERLSYQIEELTTARLQVGEDDALKEETRRMANAEQLASLTREAYLAMYGNQNGQLSASDLVSDLAGILARLAKIDPGAASLAEQAESVSVQFEELGRSLADYENEIEFDPNRLQEAETRLDMIRVLKRKYNCGTIEELLTSVAEAREQLDAIEHSEERIAELKVEETRLLSEIGQAGSALSSARKKAAADLSRAVETELKDLRMERARFRVSITQTDDPGGAPVGDYRLAFDKTGIDQVEFLIAPNIGEPPKPIARIASGGETSRIMLALKAVLSRADQTPVLIFDEIDSGIGGRIGAVIGQKLWALALSHQVLVVTHLPQLAGFADAHFKVEKHVEGDRTVTRVIGLKNQKRVEELADMLGAEALSAQTNAREILEYVEKIKARGVLANPKELSV